MEPKRILVIGAHADDCENVGGICLKLMANGHRVKFLTLTNGCSGHQTQMGGGMAVRRKQETERVADDFGIEYEVLDNPDGALTTELFYREQVIRAIRAYGPDLIFTHRPCDYHPDHRATSVLVQDAAFLVTVPNICPLTPVLRYMPSVFYIADGFQKPYPFEPRLIFDVDDVIDRKVEMFHRYTSQMYEWLPWVGSIADTNVPETDAERIPWLKREFLGRGKVFADRWRTELIRKYGERGSAVEYCEALEPCEYGSTLTEQELREVFRF